MKNKRRKNLGVKKKHNGPASIAALVCDLEEGSKNLQNVQAFIKKRDAGIFLFTLGQKIERVKQFISDFEPTTEEERAQKEEGLDGAKKSLYEISKILVYIYKEEKE